MSDTNLDMGKKRARQQQSSNVAVATADSSESGDGATDKVSANKQTCSHVAKSIDANQIKKNISLYVNGKKQCAHCKDVTEEDNKILEGSDDFWVCLRCGVKTCSLDHSASHFQVPRSDSHALTLKIPTFSVWCHACKVDILSGYNKKLKTCISGVEQLYNKQINLQPLSQQESKNSTKTKDENDETKGNNKSNEAIPLPPSKKTANIVNSAPAVRGLTNLGNTCFFNSVLQCLAQTPGLVDAIREMETADQQVNLELKSGTILSGNLGQWDSLSECLADTLVKLQSGGPVVSPERLLSLLTKKQTQFQGYRQHDAHELFTYLIDSVRMTDHKRYRKLILSEFGLYGKPDQQDVPEETTKKLKALDHEISELITFAPEKVFKGRLVNRIECQECRSVKTFEESFLDLSLPIVLDKPQPPCMRRKGGHQQYHQNQSQLETVQEENKTNNNNNSSGTTMSKSQMRKERKMQRQKNRKHGKHVGGGGGGGESKIEEEDSPPTLVENHKKENMKELEEQQDSDVEGDVEDNSEETNCGSKGSPFSKHGPPVSSDMIDVNCGNQGVWADSTDPHDISANADSDKISGKPDVVSTHSTCQQEGESHIIADLLGVEESTGSHTVDGTVIKRTCNNEKEIAEPSASSSLYLEDGKLIGCCEQKSKSDAQVTAWLNTSNLINVPDQEEADREESPPLISHVLQNTEIGVTQSRLSPQPQTSVCSNHQSSQPSLDETRSSFLRTATQETQESGYCSEKLGCPESSRRDDSPSSLDGYSPAWSGVGGALSSRSDVSLEEVFNNATVTPAGEETLTETVEVATALPPVDSGSADFPKIDSDSSYFPKKSWLNTNCLPPAHVNRRSLSEENKPFQDTNDDTPTLDSADMCSKWLEESSGLPPFEEDKEDIPTVETNEKIITDEVSCTEDGEHCGTPEKGIKFYNRVYEPLNKDQLMMGDMEELDTNSNDLYAALQGLIARPGSPCEENKTSDLIDLEINTINTAEDDSPPLYKTDVLLNETNHFKDVETTNKRQTIAAAGDKEADTGLSCGCNRSKQDSSDSCCLHTSLAQSTQAELMTGCNKIACDTCSSGNADGKSVYTNSTKQTLISQAPPALVIHLKRFQVQMMTCRKLSRHVSFPLQLDLTPYSIPSVHQTSEENQKNDKSHLLYSLYGLVEHSGTMNGGHYVAYVKVARDSSHWWYCISDSHVSQVSETRVLSAQAYLLFYKRINT